MSSKRLKPRLPIPTNTNGGGRTALPLEFMLLDESLSLSRSWLWNTNRISDLNDSDVWELDCEHAMRANHVALAWTAFSSEKCARSIAAGDAIYLFAMDTGIIAIAEAKGPIDIVKDHRRMFVNRFWDGRQGNEWRLPLNLHAWVLDADAVRWPSGEQVPNGTVNELRVAWMKDWMAEARSRLLPLGVAEEPQQADWDG